LDRAKSTVIHNKLHRNVVKASRKDLEISKAIEVEMKKVKVVHQRRLEEERPRKVKEEVARKKQEIGVVAR